MTTKLVMRGQCEPFLHLSIGAATMVYVSWFISFVCGINYHVTIDLTQVKVSFSKVLHFPKSFFTCLVINNCIEETSKQMLMDHKIMQHENMERNFDEEQAITKMSPSPTYSITNSPRLISSSATIPAPHFSVYKQYLT